MCFCCASGLLPIASCAAHHILANAATCPRMPSLCVSSLDSGRSSERPPFFENPLCNVRKRTRKGGQGGFFRPSLTFYVCNTNPFGAKAHQGPPASQSSAYAPPHTRDLIRGKTSESPQIFGRGRILRAGRRVMQRYHIRAESVHQRAFAAPLGFCPLLFVRRTIY